MLNTLKLLLPAIIPSWNFFDVIAPSPRIQYALLTQDNHILLDWQEFRPRTAHLSLPQMLARLLWNPTWNESLFMISCAERIMQQPTEHSEFEILERIADSLLNKELSDELKNKAFLQFRLELIQRKGNAIEHAFCFSSRAVSLNALRGHA